MSTRLLCALVCLFMVSAVPSHATSIATVLAGDHRDPANAARDVYRHPKETLEFFGLEPDMTVVEIWPGGGWWTEILAPLLRADGTYVAAGFVTEGDKVPQYFKDIQKALRDKLAAKPALYDKSVLTEIGVPDHTEAVPAGSADLVLTFRNVHNWVAADTADAMFAAFFTMLRPGGVLGVEDHRAPPGTSLETMKKSGYVTEDSVVALATTAGFVLDAKSEANANAKDTADYPAGVWTLPPTLRGCRQLAAGAEQDACFAKYRAIGESDRMTLRFHKPGA